MVLDPAKSRQTQILAQLEQLGSVRVEQLAEVHGVSVVTIRKDLSELEARGLLTRTHGGAIFVTPSRLNPSFYEKIGLQKPEKTAIARLAATRVREGDSLILDAGSTVLVLAQHLKTYFKQLFIVTNSLAVALELADSSFEVMLTGGQVRQHSQALLGNASVQMLETYHVDKVFLGTTGVSVEHGYTTPNPLERQTKRAMLQAAKQRFVLCDASKLGVATLSSFARLEEITELITAGVVDDIFRQQLEGRGVKWSLAKSGDSVS